MKWLRKRVERAVSEDGRPAKATADDRQAFVVLATSLIGRDPSEGSTFDAQVAAVVSAASRGSEAVALELLATAIRDHGVAISLDELSTLARCARLFGVHEDRWAFVGAAVQR